VEGGALELESESEFESEALGLAGLRVPSVSESKSAVSEHPQLKTTHPTDETTRATRLEFPHELETCGLTTIVGRGRKVQDRTSRQRQPRYRQ
jgi:hypothetical protein